MNCTCIYSKVVERWNPRVLYMRLQECSIQPLMIGMSDERMSWGGNGVSTFPVGFRFSPNDEELINHYLKKKLQGRHSEVANIPEVDLCKWEPWELPGKWNQHRSIDIDHTQLVSFLEF